MEWLRQEEFTNKFEENYRLKGICLTDSFASDRSFSELSEILLISFSYNIDEDDGLGFRNMWFGSVNKLLFTITCFQNNYSTISFREKDKTSEKYQWSFLENFIDLPHQILNRISWIRDDYRIIRNFKAEAKCSIFFKSTHSVVFEVYKGASEIEAQELLYFLRGLKSEYDYWIDEPEPTNRTWIIIKSSPNDKDKIVGRYPRRSMTEESARFMSKRDDALYRV
jgi:hypothetical protein